MSEPISVECPTCGVSMKLKDRSKLGKKAACPNCRNPFVLTASAEAGAASRSPGRKGGKTAGQRIKRHAAKGEGRSKRGLLVGGALVALLLLVGVGLWAAGVFSGVAAERPGLADPGLAESGSVADAQGEKAGGGENKLNLAYLPADVELFVQLKPAEAWKAPLLMQLAALPQVQAGLEGMQQTIGLAPADVASITVGVAGVSEQAGLAAQANPAAVAGAARELFLGVVRTTREVDAASLKLVENGGSQLQHDGKTYYLFQPPADDLQAEQAKPLAVYLAEPKLIVLGSEQQVQAAISGGGKQHRRAALDFVNPDRQLLVAFVPKDKSSLTAALPAGGPQDPVGEAARMAAKNVQAVGIGISVGSGIDVQIQASCVDEKAAGEIKQLLGAAIAQGRFEFEKSGGGMPPALAAAVEPVLSSVNVAADSATVNLSARVPETTIAALKQSGPQLLGLLMLAGMMAGGDLPGLTEPSPGLTEPLPGLTESGSVDESQSIDVPSEAPEGIEVSAIGEWSDFQNIGSDGKRRPADMQLGIYLIGEQPQAAVAWGHVKTTEIVADGERQLQPRSAQFGSDDPMKAFVPVERGEFLNEHPRQGVKAVLTFPPPAEPVSVVTRAAGTIALLVASEQKVVVLKDAQSLAGKPIDDSILDEAGLRLELTSENNVASLKIAEGNSFALAGVEAVDAAGKVLDSVPTLRSGFNNQVTYSIFLNQNAPRDAGLKLTLNAGITRVDVPFAVENVRVPLPPDVPGIPPATTDGVPEGLTLACRTDWSRTTQFSNDRPLPPALDVLVTLTGEPAQKTAAWGFVKVDRLEGADSKPLKMNVQGFTAFGDTTREFIRVERGPFHALHPAEGVRAVITLDHPPQPIQEIAAIAGSLKLHVAKEQKVVTLADFPSLVGKEISLPDLKEAGLSLKLEKGNRSLKLSLQADDASVLGNVEAVDAAGKPLEGVNLFRTSFGDEHYYTISAFGEELPADAALKLTLNLGLSEVTVPFRFETLPVPDLPIR